MLKISPVIISDIKYECQVNELTTYKFTAIFLYLAEKRWMVLDQTVSSQTRPTSWLLQIRVRGSPFCSWVWSTAECSVEGSYGCNAAQDPGFPKLQLPQQLQPEHFQRQTCRHACGACEGEHRDTFQTWIRRKVSSLQWSLCWPLERGYYRKLFKPIHINNTSQFWI